MHIKKTLTFLAICSLVITGCNNKNSSSSSSSISSSNPSTSPQRTVEEIINSMPLKAKIGQMIYSETNSSNALDTKNNNLGGIFFGGGNAPQDGSSTSWINTINFYQTASVNGTYKIPLLIGADAVHGNNNYVGATIFPQNIGLGAANNPELMAKIGEITAKEMRAIGLNMNFAPCIASALDERWGRYYESYSENPNLVDNLSLPYIKALQDNGVISTAKHYILDGATNWSDSTWNGGTGSVGQIDEMNSTISMEELRAKYLPSYKKAVDEGVKAIMAYYSSHLGTKMHANSYLINDVLKGELGFDGIVTSDYNAVLQLQGTYQQRLVTAINAGIDMFLYADEWTDNGRSTVKSTITTIEDAVNKNLITEERINDAVRRIIKVKLEMDLSKDYLAKVENTTTIGSQESRNVAKQAVRESLVLLKNKNNILPLSKNQNLLIIGPASDNLGVQSGGWTRYWQGVDNNDKLTGDTIVNAFKKSTNGEVYNDINDAAKADVVIVAIGERPYAEYYGDNKTLTLDSNTALKGNDYKTDNLKALQAAYATNLPVVVIMVSGRPLLVNDQIDKWDAFVEAWLPGTEGLGISEVLYGDYDFKGKLSVTWPKSSSQFPHSINMDNYDPSIYQFPYGFGLTYK